MSTVHPTIKIYADFDNSGNFATDISAFVTSVIDAESGIFSNNDTERTASTGSIRFDVRIDGVTYTDSVVWTGVPVKVEIVYPTDNSQIVFQGTIRSAKLDSGPHGAHEAHITASDWFEISHGTKVKGIPLSTSLSADAAIPILLDLTPNPPLNTDFEIGTEVFPYMFDGATKNTVVYSELDKITKSELGYLYLRFRHGGETLRLENYLSRSSTKPLSRFPKNYSSPSLLKYHGPSGASGYIKYHGPSSTSGRIKIHEASDASLDAILDSDWIEGDNVINEFTVTRTPRNVDASVVTLYNLDNDIDIGTGQTVTIDGSYSDPNGGTILSAFDIVQPLVALTHYKFSGGTRGTSTDLTANLLPTFVPGVNGFHVEFFNMGGPGHLWFFQVKGKALYKYNPVDYVISNVKSQEDIVRVVKPDNLTREYSSNYNTSKTFSDSIVAVNRTPRKELRSITFNASYSEELLMAFMYLEQGDKIEVIEHSPNRTGKYYIQGVKFRANLSGVIIVTWYLKEAIETITQPIAVLGNDAAAGARSAIDFGILPHLSNLPSFSYSAWVKRTGSPSFAVLISKAVDTGSGRRGNYLIFDTATLKFLSQKTPNDGRWDCSTGIGVDGLWHHIVVTYDNTKDTADPAFYADGVLKTYTEIDTPTGSSDDDSDCPLILFNTAPDPTVSGQRYYYDVIHDVTMKDVRIYDHILTAEEIAELYAGEDDYSTVQNGLLFNGIHAPIDNINDYVNDAIEGDDLVLDIVHSVAGIPYNQETVDTTKILSGLSI